MKKCRLSPLAAADLAEIWNYIAKDDPDVADRFIRELMQRISMLSIRPQIGRKRGDLMAELRQFLYRRYNLFYTRIENGIEIMRILHAARDIEAEFEM